ncbi:alpha/beta hydrolase family protein [Jatrophihabitans sp. GAS493]|uniref:alpha/beta fold hydrolase n=1 Tax=Jatrophihabitans sp. GAS493 TaxID=1907575 RepID=UPI000BB819DA|nr:alpha/beta hydrolase [Jatrophihabitans sp. GAS493]SOD70487.1 alpha/beta hydrolase family protein [Jatrophihabitans sp. GAS493]
MFALIPGAGGSAWFWHAVQQRLQAAGECAVAVELPAADESAGLPEYTETVVNAVAAEGDGSELVLVAQSLGGFTAPLVAERLGARSIVLLNAMIPLPGETPGQWWGGTGQPAAMRANDLAEGRDPDAGFDDATYFLHDLPPQLLAESANHNSPESDAVFATAFPLSKWPRIPTYVLAARDDRLFPVQFQRDVALDRLGVTAEVVPGGHLAALSYPDPITDRLLQLGG